MPPAPATCHLRFGAAGNGKPWQRGGFANPEAGFTWMLGPHADLLLPVHPGAGDLLLCLFLHAFMAPGLPGQRMGVTLEDQDLGTLWVRDAPVLGMRLPAALVAGKTRLRLRLTLPDADSPRARGTGADPRSLGCQLHELTLHWVPPEPAITPLRRQPVPFPPDSPAGAAAQTSLYVTGLTIPALLDQFESLGHNCEFGLVQQHAGNLQSQGLLRFVGIHPHPLLRGLRCGFAGVADPAQITLTPGGGNNPEWIMHHAGYGMWAHSHQPTATVTAAAMLPLQVRRATLQRRRFLQVLAGGEKLFVVHMLAPMTEPHALPILHALRLHGPNALLFIGASTAALAGSVDMLGPHLFRGHMARMAPLDDAAAFDLPAWLSVCANAYRLWRETGHGGMSEG